jgi:hypothetical protein
MIHRIQDQSHTFCNFTQKANSNDEKSPMNRAQNVEQSPADPLSFLPFVDHT